MILLNATTINGDANSARFKTPVTVYSEGAIDAGTSTISVCRDVNGVASNQWVDVKTFTSAPDSVNVFIFGVYWIKATYQDGNGPYTVATS